MALALYHYNSSVCSEKVRMVLNEKGETAGRATKSTCSPEASSTPPI